MKSALIFLSGRIPFVPVFLLLISSTVVFSQDDTDVLNISGMNWLEHTDAMNSLYRHLAGQAYQVLEERNKKVSSINTLAGWQERQDNIRETLLDIIGPFPERTDLNAKVTRIIKKDGFRVEHIIFESRPGFHVTGSLFIPDATEHKKLPAVLYCSGHTVIAYRAATGTYQNLVINLARKGFVVFAFDPVGQGERLEYYDPAEERSLVGSSTREHSYPGAQAFISGSSQAHYMTWDGIRAIDYLLTRREVDPERIGITGCSGGGTQTAYIAALDDRIRVAVNQCYITNFTRLLQSIGPQDAEQNLFHGISRHIDHADFLTVRAPMPSMVLSTTEDFFSIQGARETALEVAQIYKAYGKPGNFVIHEDMGGHGTTQSNREAMYAFFQKNLENPGNPLEEEVSFLTGEEMQVTPTGQLSTYIGGETVFSLNRRSSEKLVAQLDIARNNNRDYPSAVINSAKELSGFVPPGVISEPVFTGRIRRDGYLIEKYFLQGEGDYVIPYLLMLPENPVNKVLIYLHPSGKSAEAGPGGEIEWFVKRGFTVLAPDLLGTGETGPGIFRGDAFIEGISYNTWFASILIGRSITGIRAGDIARLTRMAENTGQNGSVYALARGELSPELLHAAAFDSSIDRVALIEPYSSYRSIVMNRFYDPAFIHSTVAGALRAYDLPDLAASVAPRKLMMVNVQDAASASNCKEEINKDLSVIINAFNRNNASGSLKIFSGNDLADYFMQWIAE